MFGDYDRSTRVPHDYKAAAAKAVETRRRNKAMQLAQRQADLDRLDPLRMKIRELEAELENLQAHVMMTKLAATLTGKSLLREHEIVAAAEPWQKSSGVYFLIKAEKVVYVGQSVHVYSRLAAHTDKDFDRYAFIPCSVEMLDKLESLYIHVLRPPLNGNPRHAVINAPINLEKLLQCGGDEPGKAAMMAKLSSS